MAHNVKVVVCRRDDHFGLRVFLLEILNNLIAIGQRNVDIHQHHIDLIQFIDKLNSLFPRRCLMNDRILYAARDDPLERFRLNILIFDNNNVIHSHTPDSAGAIGNRSFTVVPSIGLWGLAICKP